MSEHARRALALLVLAALAGVGWRVARQPALPAAVPPPCRRPVAVVGEARSPGVVCLAPTAGAAEALRGAAVRCRGLVVDSPAVDAGDRLTVVRGRGGCRLVRDRLPALALRTLRVRVDPNRADEAELRALPGVGPALARRIVEERRRAGPFASVDDLRRVRGIGPRVLRRLRGRVETRARGGSLANLRRER